MASSLIRFITIDTREDFNKKTIYDATNKIYYNYTESSISISSSISFRSEYAYLTYDLNKINFSKDDVPTPDLYFTDIVYIKDTKEVWTQGDFITPKITNREYQTYTLNVTSPGNISTYQYLLLHKNNIFNPVNGVNTYPGDYQYVSITYSTVVGTLTDYYKITSSTITSLSNLTTKKYNSGYSNLMSICTMPAEYLVSANNNNPILLGITPQYGCTITISGAYLTPQLINTYNTLAYASVPIPIKAAGF